MSEAVASIPSANFAIDLAGTCRKTAHYQCFFERFHLYNAAANTL